MQENPVAQIMIAIMEMRTRTTPPSMATEDAIKYFEVCHNHRRAPTPMAATETKSQNPNDGLGAETVTPAIQCRKPFDAHSACRSADGQEMPKAFLLSHRHTKLRSSSKLVSGFKPIAKCTASIGIKIVPVTPTDVPTVVKSRFNRSIFNPAKESPIIILALG